MLSTMLSGYSFGPQLEMKYYERSLFDGLIIICFTGLLPIIVQMRLLTGFCSTQETIIHEKIQTLFFLWLYYVPIFMSNIHRNTLNKYLYFSSSEYLIPITPRIIIVVVITIVVCIVIRIVFYRCITIIR